MSAAPNFAYANVLQRIWGAEPADAEAVVSLTLRKGRVLVQLGAAGWLLAWPDASFGVVALVTARPDGRNAFAAAWPIADAGIRHRLRITGMYQDDDALATLLDCAVDGAGLTVFDTLCAASQRHLAIGETVSARISGWAIRLAPGRTEPIILLPEQVTPSLRNAFRADFARDGRVVIQTAGMIGTLPVADGPCPMQQVDGVVRAVRPGPRLLDRDHAMLTVTVLRSEVDTEIEIVVSDEVWGRAWPQAGDTVSGLVWLHAMLDADSPAVAR